MWRVLAVLIVAAVVVWRFHLWPRHEPTRTPPRPPVVVVARPVDAATPPVDAAAPPPAIIHLALPGSDILSALLVVDGRLVWTDSAGSVWTMPARGGDPRELANQHDGPGFPMYQALALHRGTVYAARTGVIATVALPDGPVTPLGWGLGSDDAYELVSDGTALYGAMFDGHSIAKLDDDGTRTNLAAMREGVIVAAGSAVYAASFDAGTVMQLAPTHRVLARDIPHPTGFAADDRTVYAWSQRDNGLRAIDLQTGKTRMLWKPDFVASDALVPDGDWLYADATSDRGTALVRIAKDGSQLQVLVDELGHGGPIAVDADAIYAAGSEGLVRIDKARVQPLRVQRPATVPP
jgi:hypothetical protein